MMFDRDKVARQDIKDIATQKKSWFQKRNKKFLYFTVKLELRLSLDFSLYGK